VSVGLDTTTKSVEIILGAAVVTDECDITAAWVDHSSTAVTPGSTDTISAGTSAVTAVASPSSGIVRQVLSLSVHNADTEIVTVTVRLNNNGTFRPIVTTTLFPNETLYYGAHSGISVSSGGSIKTEDEFQRAGSLLSASHVGGAAGISANYQAGIVTSAAGSTLTLTNNLLIALPFVAPPRLSILNRIGVYVTTGVASCEVRLGIYTATSETNLYPNALIVDSGVLSIATSSAAAAATINTQLISGRLYWAVLNANVPSGSPVIRSAVVNGLYPIFGVPDALSTTAPQCGLSGTRTFAALSATFPASIAALAAQGPAISLRYSA